MYLFTGVTFEEKVESCAGPWATLTSLDIGSSGPYTRTRHVRIMCEAVMVGDDHQPPHNLAEISCTPISSTFEEKVERKRTLAPTMAAMGRPLRTVRSPGTLAADALGLGSVGRPAAACQLLQHGLRPQESQL